jgi:hypothetical protein
MCKKRTKLKLGKWRRSLKCPSLTGESILGASELLLTAVELANVPPKEGKFNNKDDLHVRDRMG